MALRLVKVATNYGIGHVFEQHKNAFVDWRYIYEAKNISFEQSVFTATLEMTLREFKKRYRTEQKPTFGHSIYAFICLQRRGSMIGLPRWTLFESHHFNQVF